MATDFHTRYRPFRAYATSKLANLAFAVELADRSAATPLLSVAVHPGTAMTALQRHGSRLTRAIAGALLEPLLGQSPADAARFTNSGTQVGPFLGTPATGKSAEWLGIGIYTIRDGKIADAWFAEDMLAMLLQLGTITLPT